ncbi:hypothetical protein [Kurthia massiliensis]|uniref:hypothetical protein n=1 Tax=Kurthia massiliensis TaxID=1033739 RepID=UPI000288B484|nr:hypothetical protein [Kurthia massiliensis]
MPQKSTNLPGIVKVYRKDRFTTINSQPIQNELSDLRSIGVLAYCLSMSEEFVLYKSALYNKFSRKNVDAAIRELTKKGYWVSVEFRYEGKISYMHLISDFPFDKESIKQYIDEAINQGFKFVRVSCCYDDLSLLYSKCNGTKNDNLPLYPRYSTKSTSNNKKAINKKTSTKVDDESCNVNTVLTSSEINIDDQLPTNLVDLEESRLNAIKAQYPNINDDWFTQIYSKAKSDGRIKNAIAYVAKSAKKFNDSIKAKELAMKQQQVEKGLPEWFKNGDHKNFEDVQTKQNEHDAEYFEAKRKEINAKLGI